MSLITLISDFGNKDYYVALLKAALYRFNEDITVIDVTHDITRHDIMEASFYLESIYDKFPLGSIHIVNVNSFYAKKSELIIFEKDGFFFVGPNNGLFSLVFPTLNSEKIYCVEEEINVESQYEVIGYVTKQLASGYPITDLGPKVSLFDQKINLQPVITSSQIRATIVHIDQFGNVIINLDNQVFEKIRDNREYAIYYKSNDPITALSKGYSDAPIGDVCAFFNTIGRLEIAVNMGNAHELLNLNKNETIQINFH